MCDTVGKILSPNYAIFGKNSDRAVNEPQVVEFYPAKDYKDNEKLKCTYIEIDQVPHTNAIILSRPSWIWGGEIGVNEFGVCIGNEAVFTKGKYGKDSLIGMDYLRLALERSSSAKDAIDVIISLLEKYDQGGNCGFDSNFHYDNSYLVMDRKEIYVLETVGIHYTYKKYNHASISNCLSIGEDGDYYSDIKKNFKKTYSDPIMTFGACGIKRRELSSNHKLDGIKDMMDLLSTHQPSKNVFRTGSVDSICMHAANQLTADQTTMSMIVELKENDILIWLTGSSLPCVSLYKPAMFKKNGLIFDNENENTAYWLEHEKFNRKLVSSVLPIEFYKEKKEFQDRIISGFNANPTDDGINNALALDREFFDKYKGIYLRKVYSNFIYRSFWSKKNKNLK